MQPFSAVKCGASLWELAGAFSIALYSLHKLYTGHCGSREMNFICTKWDKKFQSGTLQQTGGFERGQP